MYGEDSDSIITAAAGDTKDWKLDVRLEVEENECGRESVDEKLEADSGEEQSGDEERGNFM